MRRKDREKVSRSDLVEIIEQCDVCRIAFTTETAPYVVPLNFGYRWDGVLPFFYFHCAVDGRKLRLLAKNNFVGFEMDTGHLLGTSDLACEWGMKYKSIIGTGVINEITDENGKKAALDSIMRHYRSLASEHLYNEAILCKTKVLQLTVVELSGKEKC